MLARKNPPPPSFSQDADERKKLVQELHLLKTDMFMQLIESGAMPLRCVSLHVVTCKAPIHIAWCNAPVVCALACLILTFELLFRARCNAPVVRALAYS